MLRSGSLGDSTIDPGSAALLVPAAIPCFDTAVCCCPQVVRQVLQGTVGADQSCAPGPVVSVVGWLGQVAGPWRARPGRLQIDGASCLQERLAMDSGYSWPDMGAGAFGRDSRQCAEAPV
jgi:hypothetical protein